MEAGQSYGVAGALQGLRLMVGACLNELAVVSSPLCFVGWQGFRPGPPCCEATLMRKERRRTRFFFS